MNAEDEIEIAGVVAKLENHEPRRIGRLAELGGPRGQSVEEVMKSLDPDRR